MLNISENNIPHGPAIQRRYGSFEKIIDPHFARVLAWWLVSLFVGFVILLFLPWTQNISGQGQVTTLRPEHRPQTIVSTIDGKIERWYVTEGDTVQLGDTILHISEIKDDYFDPRLLERADQQVTAKVGATQTYRQKAEALARQIAALREVQTLKTEQLRNKIEQARLKVRGDSIDLVAADTAQAIAYRQYLRAQRLLEQGIESRTKTEDRLNKYRAAQAKYISQRAKLETSQQSLVNARIELANIPNEYAEKIAKAQSDRQSALSNLFQAEGDVAKLENTRSNYEQRVNFRYILAPQRGFINKALKPGIGEAVKQGEGVVSIVPLDYQIAVEMFIEPLDLPLIRKGEEVRLQFDGWPAFVFSGWPGASFGTFGGIVFAVETNISNNGKYRILIAPDPEDEPWPDLIRVGAGANGFALLDDVPVWYELWRQLNGFPANFYTGDDLKSDKKEDGVKVKK